MFESLGASAGGPFLTTRGDRPERLFGHQVTARLFDVLQVRPVIGAGITVGDETSGEPVALISDGLWRRRFNADPNVVGRTLVFETATTGSSA